ncbi:MAG: CpXC domain-containing protein [Alphaproteobacteria bacterium]|nr:CpXC domain-containing protein [Alphaproteobacteria bacterium]
MSIADPSPLTCPDCGASTQVKTVHSINADRAPGYRQAILDGDLQRVSCPSCEASLRVEPSLTYVDEARGLWIRAWPLGALPEWEALEAETLMDFERLYRGGAPRMVRDLGERLSTRITFGWAGLREKLLCDAHDIDDATLELVKMRAMRASSALYVDEDLTLRLSEVLDDALLFVWLEGPAEEVLEPLAVPLRWLEEIEARPMDWNRARHSISGGPFVDLNRAPVA